jgi:N-acetylmuramoyl-L-alanine amidase
MTIGIYLIKTVFISGLLFGYFWLFLRNRSFHRFNRIFLISIPVLSLLLPSFHFNLPGFWNPSTGGSPIRLLGVGQGRLEEAVTVYASKSLGNIFSLPFISMLITFFISSFLLIRFIKTIRFLLDLRKDKVFMELPEATVYFVSEEGTPFSFFKFIFWGKETEINSPAGRQILRHELFHVKKNHSLDIVGIELVSILLWFNPFIHLIIRELKVIHEYEADEYATTGMDEYEYASLLLMKISGSPLSLTNPFFKNQIKRRIAMITKSNKNKKAMMGRLMILPIVTLLICLFSFKMNKQLIFHSQKTIKVVIDPGHGGVFTGTQFNGVLEKDINLSLAKKIQMLSKEYNVEVIMTRDKDEDMAGNDLRASLDYRTGLAAAKNADLFISIHMNNTESAALQDKYSGFEIYVPGNSSKVYDGSVKLGTIIASNIKPDYIIAWELKQTATGVRVLDKATVPAIVIECGYMDNKADMEYMQIEKNQEKIARDILEGIRKYGAESNGYSEADSKQDYKIITEQEAQSLPDGAVQGFDFDKEKYLIIINTKDGKKYAYGMSDEMKRMIDNPKEVEKKMQENQDGMKEEMRVLDSMNNANPNNHSIVLTQAETTAEFPGGQNAWRNFLIKNLNYPAAAEKKELQGEVIVAFIVRKDGSLADIHAISGPVELRPSSVAVIKNSGKWIPAMNNGLVVESYKRQPINYKLEAK